jgi:succinylglutamic semialdehyde dehydrogenase
MAEPASFEPRGDYIGGRFALPEPVAGEIALECPADTRLLSGAFPFGGTETLGAAIDAARRAWPAWRDAAPQARAAHLRRFAQEMSAARETLAEVIALEIGKPLWEARTEVDAMIGKVEITLDAGLAEVADRELALGAGQVGRWRHHARGALAVLGPFNFPGHLTNGHVIPALATGNTCVVKPSERAAAVGQLYAELADRAGFPPGVFNLVQGDASVGAALAADPRLDGVLFTGSWAVGRRILEANLDQPHKLLALEMGGKNAVLVCEDADLDAAAAAIAFGACVTAGQRCSATSRVLVLPRVAEALTARLVRLFREIAVGYPLDDGVFMGPVISAAARARHAQVLAWAREEGAEALVAGGPFQGPRPGHYVRPSLHRVASLSRSSRYQREEHFVPDLWIHPVDSLEDGIAAIDATDYGLVASVFSARREVFERVFRETRLGLINWNTTTVGASSRLPFGGVKRSGNERPAGAASPLYCVYPVASLEVERPSIGRWPGFPGPA